MLESNLTCTPHIAAAGTLFQDVEGKQIGELKGSGLQGVQNARTRLTKSTLLFDGSV